MPSSSRARPRPGLPVANGGNLEGKEVRLGPVASATWAAMTTATSNGSVNAMHDSFQPLGGLVPMALMMLNVDFSGIGAGFLNMLMYIIVAVFLAGLMVGRTPEYLGKKIEAREVKLAMIVVLIHPLLITCGTALFAATDWGQTTAANPGPHGFSEVLYEFTSAAANNGSGFEGLSDNNPAWNIATGVVLLLGRFPALVLPIAIAGFLAEKKRTPTTSGTLLDQRSHVRAQCSWGRCSWSGPSRSCRPSFWGPSPTICRRRHGPRRAMRRNTRLIDRTTR